MEPTGEDLYEGFADLDACGAWVSGPPWILGHRGTPREAPENTLSGLRRALSLGMDGVEYDVRAAGGGEVVLLHDATLDRTTDANGPLAARELAELFGVDAGGWFGRSFRGEPLPTLQEALDELGEAARRPPLHMVELKEEGLVKEVARQLAEVGPRVEVRVASFLRKPVLAARDAGLPAMLLGVIADEDDRRFVRDERIQAYSVGPGGWDSEAGRDDWSFAERWSWSLDDPEELLRHCRTPLFGFNTNDPYRAMAARALVRLAPDYDGGWPLAAAPLVVEPETLDSETRQRGEWFGAWAPTVRVRNPFPFPVEARLSLFIRSGAFELDGLPRAFDLEALEERSISFALAGGARVPGDDPLLAVLLRWRGSVRGEGEMRAGGQLLFDAPLVRERVTLADGLARRLTLLPERMGDPPASLSIHRDRGDLILSLENPGGLDEPHLLARLGGETVRGGRGLRLQLPDEFDANPRGIAFSCGLEGTQAGEPRLRRWAGGLPGGLGNGSAGRLLPLGKG